MLQTGKMEEIAEELKKSNIQIAASNEVDYKPRRDSMAQDTLLQVVRHNEE
jgi:hypothetical protein